MWNVALLECFLVNVLVLISEYVLSKAPFSVVSIYCWELVRTSEIIN